ncbi:MAG TPA: helix-turn-helix domain-containing protein, partial [Hanamia sp.]|nr:helix-turn-helix domain-containing protein [Hanamia sp.]
ATVINETLLQLLLSVHTANYFLGYCKQPFSVTTFLQHKLKFAQPRLNISCYASGKKQSYTDVPNPELYDTLKRWRDMVCEENRMPIYMVANQNALKEIAAYLPFTKKELMQISGFGKAKSEKYGNDILDAVRDYCDRNNLESNMAAKETNPKKERKEKPVEERIPTNTVSFNLFKEGKSIAEIAKERNMAISTIEGHLALFVANGEIDINKMVSEKNQLLIKEAVKIHGRDSFKTLKENLPEDITYGEIRMVLAAEKGDEKA